MQQIEADDFLAIPDFLKVENRTPLTAEQQARLNEWLRRPCRSTRRKPLRWHDGHPLPQTVEPQALALFHDIERRQRERQKERFAALRERGRR